MNGIYLNRTLLIKINILRAVKYQDKDTVSKIVRMAIENFFEQDDKNTTPDQHTQILFEWMKRNCITSDLLIKLHSSTRKELCYILGMTEQDMDSLILGITNFPEDLIYKEK